MLGSAIAHSLKCSGCGRICFVLVLFLFPLLSLAQRIPVVVHIISTDPDAITDNEIRAYIADLNDAFAHTGFYGSGPGANTGISFCLAQKDPNGGITIGITRTKSELADFDMDIENTRLKSLISWDTRQYLNIWYVKGIKSEIFPEFSCGKWASMKAGGYATYPGGDFRDGVVLTAFGRMAAHEVGHYLGLKHTFTRGSCINNDCSVDGDGICDTPPTTSFGGPCAAGINTCSSDTLSGFTTDQPDLNENFMSYSGCSNMFTEGQAAKMREVLATVRSSLLVDNKCDKPCGENIVASYTRDNWFPTTGSTVNFTSTSTGGNTYEWFVNGVVSGTNSPNFSHNFPVNGKYNVTLRVSNGTSCYSTYTHYVIVTCGVMARFVPDKRFIASKAPYLIDTILFKNRSINATAFNWLMSNDTGMAEQVVATTADLFYPFKDAGNYVVRLVASNGGCADTTEMFGFTVADPTMDGVIGISNVVCYQETRLRFDMTICNNGYAVLPLGIPVSFYDGDPRQPGATKLGSTFIIPDSLLGKCCSSPYPIELDVKRTKLNILYAAFNDPGTTNPVVFPATKYVELNYANNVGVVSGFKFTARIIPDSVTLEPGDSLRFQGRGLPTPAAEFAWRAAQELDCTTCPNPLFTAARRDVQLMLTTKSTYGCTDTGYANVKVPVVDDLVPAISTVRCSNDDSLRVNFDLCNTFKRGYIPKDVKVSFYDGDPRSGGKLLLPVFTVPASTTSKCASYVHTVKAKGAMKIFAVVNDKGVSPFSLPNDTVFAEKDLANNVAEYTYTPDSVIILPADTTVLRKSLVQLKIGSAVYDPATVAWSASAPNTLSCTTCLLPQATVNGDGNVTMRMKDAFGCTLQGQARLKILPPDLRVTITGINCYTNAKTLVRFRICMNNNYDSVAGSIPVSFYDTDPYTSRTSPIDAVFLTPQARPSSCDTFRAVINTPGSGMLYIAVNDRGRGPFPDPAIPETNLSNNTDMADAPRFRVSVLPTDTIVYRNTNVPLRGVASGGSVSSSWWSPASNLSCDSCFEPVAKLPYSQAIVFTAKNEYFCVASDTADIKTYSDGPVNLPNAFTPNGDGRNDVFYVIGSKDILEVKEFSIYDRYGQKVFMARNTPANNPVYGWKGVSNAGKPYGTATFVYAITIAFKDGSEKFYKGTITLIR